MGLVGWRVAREVLTAGHGFLFETKTPSIHKEGPDPDTMSSSAYGESASFKFLIRDFAVPSFCSW